MAGQGAGPATTIGAEPSGGGHLRAIGVVMLTANSSSHSQAPIGQPGAPAPQAGSSDRQGLGAAAPVWLSLAGLLIAALYWDTFRRLAAIWDIDPNYSHGYIVPLVSAAIGWTAWKRHGNPFGRSVGTGVVALGSVEIVLALGLHMVSTLFQSLLFDVVALILMLRGILLVWGGREASRQFAVATLFLIFMAPLPVAWYQPVAIVLQQVVSSISATMLDICGVPAYREGYFVFVPGYTMEVGEACSGLRQLTAVLALAVALAYFSQRGRWFGWTLALLSVPIAVVSNCIRVMLTGLIMMWFGREWAEGVYHTLEGLVIVALAAALVVGAAWILANVEGWVKRRSASSDGSAAQGDS